MDIETVERSYTCPRCHRWHTKEFVTIPTKPGAHHGIGHYCSCESFIRLHYTVERKIDGKLKIKIEKFLCRGEEFHPKWLWSPKDTK